MKQQRVRSVRCGKCVEGWRVGVDAKGNVAVTRCRCQSVAPEVTQIPQVRQASDNLAKFSPPDFRMLQAGESRQDDW